MKVAATGQQVTGKSECQHEWVEVFDANADAACYNDGLNYRPAEEICTKCGKKQKIKYEDEAKWYKVLLLLPFAMLYLGIIAPVLMLILTIKGEILASKKS